MNMDKTERIPVFFTIDDNYAPILGAALKSLTANASRDRKYIINIIHDGLSEKNEARLAAMSDDTFDIRTVPMSIKDTGISDRKENHLRCDYFTMTIFYRLFIPEMFPQYDKGIYLDSDIIIPGDISQLYDIALEGNLIGACPDRSVTDIPELVSWIENGTGVRRDRYVNSGVLLMDMKKLRENRFLEHFLKLLNTWHFESIAPDQDYINAICEGRIRFLGEEWDVMPNQGRPLFMSPKIIHYNLFEKPWLYDGVQYADYFWKYAHQSDFHEDICRIMENYTDAQRRRDRICLENMISKAANAPLTGVTFPKAGKEKVRLKDPAI